MVVEVSIEEKGKDFKAVFKLLSYLIYYVKIFDEINTT